MSDGRNAVAANNSGDPVQVLLAARKAPDVSTIVQRILSTHSSWSMHPFMYSAEHSGVPESIDLKY